MVSPYAYIGMKNTVVHQSVLSEEQNNLITDNLIACVCEFYKVDLTKIKSRDRHEPTMTARHVSIWFVRQKTNYSLKKIGQLFGKRDHTSVIHSLKVVNDQLTSKFDNPIKSDIPHLKMII